jgi:c-di-GMP-binding flagellar brake protein YcgR
MRCDEESMEDAKYRKEREYSRVDAYLPLKVRAIPQKEQNEVRSRSSQDFLGMSFPNLPEIEDPILAGCMRAINAKLDAILNFLKLQDQGMVAPQVLPVNISGSGLRFYNPEPFAQGDLLEICLVLPTQPDTMLYTYGEVIRSEPAPCARHNTCVSFTVIDEDIREKIVKFVFERQRELLRKQRRQ